MSGRYWDKLCAILRYGFIHSRDNGRVLKIEDVGNWVERGVLDAAQDKINALAQRCWELEAEVERCAEIAAENAAYFASLHAEIERLERITRHLVRTYIVSDDAYNPEAETDRVISRITAQFSAT